MRELRLVQTTVAGDESAVLYDADLEAPRGTHRFAEFFRIEGESIPAIRLVFDPTEFRAPRTREVVLSKSSRLFA